MTPAGGLRTTLERLVDIALPPTRARCGIEGQLLCVACRPALESRLERPGGVRIGIVAEIPEPLLQLEWCGLLRAAVHAPKYGALVVTSP